ncbi:hypothetical protein B0H19DRAFT_1113174 [Mycena capillaripes]|nr:hypothetical protein B0H19DRAFT_1113174 [Mycena capillaripes]
MKLPALDYVINHLFLPPKLPQEDDSDDLELQQELLQHISDCAKSFCEGLRNDNVDDEVQTHWKLLGITLEHFATLHNTPTLSKENLKAIINRMRLHDVICFHVNCQNAGVILRRGNEEIFVEFFQASSSAALVTEAKGKLVIQYPFRPRLSLPLHGTCITSVSALLADLDCTRMPDSLPKTMKAGGAQDELRDVGDIRYITELFGGIARGIAPVENSSQTASSTVYVTKRIDDHVLWKDAFLPWRRSPKWLIVRVALQTSLAGWKVPEQYGYKVFIAFVLAKTLDLAKAGGVCDDILFIMNAKIATRMWKIRLFFECTPRTQTSSPFPIQSISQAISSVEHHLRCRWDKVKADEAKPSTWAVPTSEQVQAAWRFTLPRSFTYLETAKARGHVFSSQTATFDSASFEDALRAKYRSRVTHSPGVPPDLPELSDLIMQVVHLEQWLSLSSGSASLSELSDLITRYDEIARSFKSRNPEIFSRIFLAVLELWMVLDKTATSVFPLLLDYPPELLVNSFEPLLLPKLSQMERLRKVEIHLANRRTRVRYPHVSVFTSDTNANSLPSRHFDTDGNMQTLRRTIQTQASQRKNQKIQELRTMTDTHTALLEEARRLDHRWISSTDRWGCTSRYHASDCTRCAKEREAAAMTITQFEWPLPEDDTLNRLVVFELCVPEAFDIWRDATYCLARNYSNLKHEDLEDPTPDVVLQDYAFLRDHFKVPYSRQRITIASTAKSFLQSHYRCHKFPCSERDIIQKHPLRYQLWDKAADEWLPSSFPIIDIRTFCTPNFLSAPYQSLMWTAISTTHTPNEVIANQSRCSAELSYHEWEKFGHLRAGVRLQWRNIMLELISGSIELSDPAVHLLFQQAAWQAETALDEEAFGRYREAHFDLSQEKFGLQIVRVLEQRLASIAGNWKEGWTAATLGILACRLFSLSPFELVKQEVLVFLSHLRKTLSDWMEQVSVLLSKPSGPGMPAIPRAHLVNRILQLAASCRQTYAVGSDALLDVLRDDGAISIFIRCAITLHTHVPPRISDLPSALRYLLDRDVIIAVEALKPIIGTVSQSGDGIDKAVSDTWQGFSRDCNAPWQMVGEQWIKCVTSAASGKQVLSVYLNLLNGSLLVDGKAQGILPKEIIGHSFFKTLFPNRSTLNIVPSTMKGMDYQSRDNMNGFEVHFKLDDSLLIRIHNGEFVSEFIPPDHLHGDIPESLIAGMVHIFHEKDHLLEIYESPSGWQPLAQAAWCLDLAPQSHSFLRVSKNAGHTTEFVLDPNSSVVQKISDIFRPLEACETNLTISSFSFRPERLRVKLPRYNLEFLATLAGDHLESKELPGFYVSPVQSIGTLIGVRNKLVLKSVNGEMRKVFIPEGKIEISGGATKHPVVAISPPVDAKQINIFSYDIDEIVGRVVGDGSLTSWYRLAHLHIATTSHLCDPLLRRTGLQQAQEMLGSAQAFAFLALEEEHCTILQQILDLAPIREYYPTHLTSMETVGWHGSLSVLVQCGRFVPLVNAIVDYARKQSLFCPSHQTFTAAYKGKTSLWERADARVSRFVSSVQINGGDELVSPRRCLGSQESTAKEHVVAGVVALVREWPANFNFTDGFELWNRFERWKTFSTVPELKDKIHNYQLWLQEPAARVWFRLFHLCRASFNRDRDQYGLMVALGILAYREDIDIDLIRALLAIATNTDSPIIQAANNLPLDTFDLGSGHTLGSNEVLETVTENCHENHWGHPDSAWMERQYGESHNIWRRRRESAFQAQRDEQCRALARHIFGHWPALGATLTLPNMASVLPNSLTHYYPIVKMANLRTALEDLFTTKLRNRRMFEASNRLQTALGAVQGLPRTMAIPALLPSTAFVEIPSRKYAPLTLGSLLGGNDPNSKHPSQALRQLISQLGEMPSNGPKSQYIADLSRCVDAFDKSHHRPEQTIQTHLRPKSLSEQFLDLTGQWPSTGPQTLLHQLSRDSWKVLSEYWKGLLCRYAEGLAAQQQQRRITVLDKLGFAEESAREAQTRGGQDWDPSKYPDWLLIQLDADILIRPLQASIAMNMMFPESRRNALLQLNMGEGKSSVIVPIISTALADGQLVRVVVLKPLVAQMFQLLKQRVSGLANRRLFYLPFSRDVELDPAKIRLILALFKECAECGGILLCQPEHILSFQLMGLDAFSRSETSEETRLLREAQDWLDSTARDVLDESDEILNVRYQLIYTVGASIPPEGRPWRWNITQAVFSLLQTAAKTIGDGLEIGEVLHPRQFSLTRILASKGGQDLIDSIVKRIVFEDGLQEWISFRNYSEADKEIVLRFLQDITLDDDQALRDISGDSFGHLLLLRGLFAHGILNLSLREKRWRVDYGLDAKRSMLAVPYRAKDSPAPRAEFGHPDMIIVLTCLSYYYGGLTDDQLDACFRLLLHCDNPESQYEYWVSGIPNLPETLKNLRGLNLDDFEQKTRAVFPKLRYNKAVIDFYLSECVFPKEAREFPHKLTTNAWDLARTRPKLTTGFSGTNDNKYLLPLSIEQCDQESQRHTNAQVIGYLLSKENRAVFCTDHENALGLVEHVVQQKPAVMVLLDVGAQVLELQNEEVAREWLKLDTRPQVEAAVYFDPSTDEIRVISRDGRIQPFASSLYKKQLDKTLVYLDEAHTRGTDFKFPTGSRAVVTLGPRLTKDKLVQGCMRMRRLGKDHSVLFFASAEIRSRITAATGAQSDEIDSMQVVKWTIQETCVQIKDNGSLWANQGFNFDARRKALEEYDADNRSYGDTIAALRERESRTLDELYGVKSSATTAPSGSRLKERIMERCRELAITPSDSSLSEEQERELAHEKEDEREVERVADAKARDHCDRDLQHFITTGTIGQFSTFISLEDCLAHTSWVSSLPQGEIFRGRGLWATRDFRDTIVLRSNPSPGSMNDYLRPVQWIVSGPRSDTLILISPFEANKWLPEIRRSKIVYLHLYSPRISRNTFWPLDALDSFTVPAERSVPIDRQLIHELNLFAGQLFCADKRSVKDVCGILGLHLQSVGHLEGLQGTVDSKGFVQERARAALGLEACSFVSTPLPFFRELYGTRRKGQGFALTHMGQILRGNDPKDPAFEEGDEPAQ